MGTLECQPVRLDYQAKLCSKQHLMKLGGCMAGVQRCCPRQGAAAAPCEAACLADFACDGHHLRVQRVVSPPSVGGGPANSLQYRPCPSVVQVPVLQYSDLVALQWRVAGCGVSRVNLTVQYSSAGHDGSRV
jgi:hypothetical protein